MKKLIVQIVLAAAFMGLGAAFAEEQDLSKLQKDECLLISKDCKSTAMSIQEKMTKLQAEIDKGKRVYTPEELKKLEEKLKDTENMLDKILTGP